MATVAIIVIVIFPTRRLTEVDYDVDKNNRCSKVEVPSLVSKRKPFQYLMRQLSDGNLGHERQSCPQEGPDANDVDRSVDFIPVTCSATERTQPGTMADE